MKFNPFIPIKDGNVAIIAGNANSEIIDSLNRLGMHTISTVKCIDVDDSIAYHPDIVIHPINYNTLVIAPNVFDYYQDRLERFNFKLIKGEKKLVGKYPLDIAYNVGRIYGRAIHNFKYTDEVLKFYLKKEGLEFININQGYTKCSMAIVDENSIITADVPIYNILKNLGYDVLLIKPGYIHLEKQDYGFIGGSTGNFSKDKMFFSGILDSHPDRNEIQKFIHKKNKKIIYLSKKTITDIGTIISLNCN
jgi:N-dimethylarginine dimethylaminohydrolase